MGEYEPKIEVQFPEVVPVAKSTTVTLECFALGKYVFYFSGHKQAVLCLLCQFVLLGDWWMET